MGQEIWIRGLIRPKRRMGGTASSNPTAGTVAAKIDLEDGPSRRLFANKAQSFVVLPDITVSMNKAGSAVAAGTASGMVYRAPRAMKVYGVVGQLGVIPSGSGTTILDVKKVAGTAAPTAAGVSIFTDATRRPMFMSGTVHTTYTPYGGTTFAGQPGTGSTYTVDLAAGDYLRVEVAGTAATSPGQELSVQIFGY